ncbi:MAG: RluA family pseudouridine synthase [Bdellovibrionaceae bacterium]|nr:RluA family pseudouridine synthase [Pseudobdellovibrionaceae bacterium]MDW8189752.1 RluA family pseudouridine synthase [Pseudobdellovibrionaceae bacterium]
MGSQREPLEKIDCVHVTESDIGRRLDQFLAKFDSIGSRTQATRLIDNGQVTVNHQIVTKSSFRLKKGDYVCVALDLKDQKATNLVPVNKEVKVIFEDPFILVVSKPAGLVVHPSLGHEDDSLVHRLIGRYSLSQGYQEDRPGIVHRLDRQTSGLLVIAKNDRTHRQLALQFQKKTAFRLYQAVCLGIPKWSSNTIVSFLSRHPTNRKKWSSVRSSDGKIIRDRSAAVMRGKLAITHVQLLAARDGMSFLNLKLETGRTHQIRVHLSELNLPILGDELYGFQEKKMKNKHFLELSKGRIFLHAYKLGFVHPDTGQECLFVDEWPSSEKALIETYFRITS